jgi:predicted transcriptional regulator
MASPTQRIAEIRGITVPEVHKYCKKVRAQANDNEIHYNQIAKALASLGANAPIEEIAKEALRLERTRRKREPTSRKEPKAKSREPSRRPTADATTQRIAEILGITTDKVSMYCEKVRAKANKDSILRLDVAKVLEVLSADAPIEEVAEAASRRAGGRGAGRPRKRKRGKGRWQSPRTPGYIWADGGIRSTSAWRRDQKPEEKK